MYVLEMRSYMQDAEGSNSREPISRISRHEDTDVDPEHNPAFRLIRKRVPMSKDYDGRKLFTKQNGKRIATPLLAGPRNETHVGFEQHFGHHFNVSADYIWKYTQYGGDFSVLGSTPITFPIAWHNSKITGIAGRVDVTHFRRLLAYMAFSSVAARFFPPQVAGAGATVGQTGFPFRIDHDEKFNQTTHIQYSLPLPTAPWIGFNWRFDSGMVAGAVPCYNPRSNDANSACANSSGRSRVATTADTDGHLSRCGAALWVAFMVAAFRTW